MATLTDTREVILSGPESYYEWLQAIKSTISKTSWKYVDPEEEDDCPEPGPYPTLPRAPTPPPAPTGTQTRAASQASNTTAVATPVGPTALDIQLHTAQCNEWRAKRDLFKEFTHEETKLRERIQRTIDPTKRTRLVPAKSTREWLKSLRDSYQPDLAYYQQSIIARYTKFVNVYYSHWPSNGPEKWLSEWEQLLDLNEEYNKEHQFNWRLEFHGVWKRVADARSEVEKVRDDISKKSLTYHKAASMLRMAWSQTSAQDHQKPASKSHAIRSAFPALPRFDNKPPESNSPSSISSQPPAAAATDQPTSEPSKRSSRKRAGTSSRQRGPSKRRGPTPCIYCDGIHKSEECYLALGIKKDKVAEENHKVFTLRTRDLAIQKKVEALRAYKRLFSEGEEVGGQ